MQNIGLHIRVFFILAGIFFSLLSACYAISFGNNTVITTDKNNRSTLQIDGNVQVPEKVFNDLSDASKQLWLQLCYYIRINDADEILNVKKWVRGMSTKELKTVQNTIQSMQSKSTISGDSLAMIQILTKEITEEENRRKNALQAKEFPKGEKVVESGDAIDIYETIYTKSGKILYSSIYPQSLPRTIELRPGVFDYDINFIGLQVGDKKRFSVDVFKETKESLGYGDEYSIEELKSIISKDSNLFKGFNMKEVGSSLTLSYHVVKIFNNKELSYQTIVPKKKIMVVSKNFILGFATNNIARSEALAIFGTVAIGAKKEINGNRILQITGIDQDIIAVSIQKLRPFTKNDVKKGLKIHIGAWTYEVLRVDKDSVVVFADIQKPEITLDRGECYMKESTIHNQNDDDVYDVEIEVKRIYKKGVGTFYGSSGYSLPIEFAHQWTP